MDLKIGSDYNAFAGSEAVKRNTSADSLSDTISGLNKNSTDEELMAACKSFEEYLVEQVVKSTRKTMMSEDEEGNDNYLGMFSDTMNQQYAKIISENGNLGIAKMLFDSMKNNTDTFK